MKVLSLMAFFFTLATGFAYGYDFQESKYVTCESQDWKTVRCEVKEGRIVDVFMVNQRSRTACRQGSTWTYNRNFVQVSGGCRATFKVVYVPNRRPPRDDSYYITCSSQDFRYAECPLREAGSRIMFVEQLSRSKCERGQSWGVDRSRFSKFVWVDKGCRAKFKVTPVGRRW